MWGIAEMTDARINVYKTGLVVGIVLGGWHLCWSALVAIGMAQRIADFIFWMHFIKPVYVIEPFEISRAILLVLVTAAIGFVVGAAGAWAWNVLHKR
jgi:hypothetical protein